MNRLLQGLLPLSLLAITLSGCSKAASNTTEAMPVSKENPATKAPPASSSSQNAPARASGIDSLCANHYNSLHLTVDKFEAIKTIIDRNKKASVAELKTALDAKNITLNEASWGLYYLGQKSLGDKDFPHFVKYLTVAADDYLNPWAMVLLAKVYFYDKAEWKKQFPDSEITTDKDLEKSFTYLTLAFVISGEIEKDHHDNFILTGVTNGGLAMQDTFQGTGISGFDARATLAKHRKDLLEKGEQYKTMYEKGK